MNTLKVHVSGQALQTAVPAGSADLAITAEPTSAHLGGEHAVVVRLRSSEPRREPDLELAVRLPLSQLPELMRALTQVAVDLVPREPDERGFDPNNPTITDFAYRGE